MWWFIQIAVLSGRVVCDDYIGNFKNETYLNLGDFVTVFEWSYVNFTWNSNSQYSQAIQQRKYIPENVMPGGIKFYEGILYVALPKFRSGVPVTLTSLPVLTNLSLNNLLSPYPSWEANDDSSCDNLQSMLNMEIDTKGVMYIIDGVRMNNNNVRCPCKIVLVNVNNYGRLIQSLILSTDLCHHDGGFLNDIVIDESDGGFAYITDTSNIDPGIIVFSRYQNRAWKIRDQTMFTPQSATSFIIAGNVFSQLTPVDGLALSPKALERKLYFCSLMAYDILALSTHILKNEQVCRLNIWRKEVQNIGQKQSQTDGMMMDSKGNLYYSLIPLYGAGKWNMFEPFETSEIIYTNRKTFVWTDGFGMDQEGYLYLMTNWAYRYFETNYTLEFSPNIVKFRIHKLFTGSKSYLYNDIK